MIKKNLHYDKIIKSESNLIIYKINNKKINKLNDNYKNYIFVIIHF